MIFVFFAYARSVGLFFVIAEEYSERKARPQKARGRMKQVNVLAEDAWYTLAAGRKVSEVRAWLRDCRILFYPIRIRRSFGFCNCGFAAPLDSAFLPSEYAYSEITCLAKARFGYQILFRLKTGTTARSLIP